MSLESAYQRVGQIMDQSSAARPQVEATAAARPADPAQFGAHLSAAMQPPAQLPGSAFPGAVVGQSAAAPMFGAAGAPSGGVAAQYLQFALQQGQAAGAMVPGMPLPLGQTAYGAPVPVAAMPAPANLSGDLDGLNPRLATQLSALAGQLGKRIEVVSGFRSRDEQARLYEAYLNGTGNLAAPPGRSNHESGNAADVYIDGVALANVPGARESAAGLGLHFPVAGEAWHVELM